MQDTRKTNAQLLEELTALRQRLAQLEAELTLPAAVHVATPAQAAFDFAGVALVVTDLQDRWLQGNQAWFQMLGYTPAELQGVAIYELTHPRDVAESQRQMQALIEGRVESYRLKKRYLRKDGEVVWVDLSVTPIRDENGTLVALIGAAVDITEREQIELDMRKTEARLRAVIEDQTELICRFQPDGRLTFVNEAYCRYFGKTRAELLDHNFMPLIPAEDQAIINTQTAKLSPDSPVTTYEHRVILADGEIRWQQWTDRALYDADGELVEFQSVGRDITERKQIEEALRRSEERYRTLIENQGEGLGLVDPQENFVFANPSAERLFGVPAGGLIGRNLSEFVDADQYRKIEIQTTLRQLGQQTSYELDLHRADARACSLLVTAVPQFNDRGEFTGTFGVFRDITDRKQVEAEIKRLNAELEQRVVERTAELERANAELQDDIQQRQRVEDMLRRSEHRYRTLFESAGDAIFILGLDGKILEVNQVACERLGYSHGELLGMDAATIHAPHFAPGVLRRIEQVRHLGSLAFESAHVRRDGTVIPIELNNRVIEYAGAPAILSIARDITERKHSENRLRRYTDEQAALYEIALRLSAQLNLDELLQLLVEQAVVLLAARAAGIYLHDAQRDVLALKLGVDFFGEYVGVELKPGEGLSGQAFQTRQVMKLDDYHVWEARAAAYRNDDRLKAAIAVPLLGKHAVLGVLIIAGDEDKLHFTDHEARLAELFAAQAAIALENAQLYERQQEQYRRLQDAQVRLIQAEKMSALGRLLASISHEINNPLQAVNGCLTLVREGLEEGGSSLNDQVDNLLQDLNMATAEVQRIAGIVQRLRDFYRPARTGVQPIKVQSVLDAVLALTAKQLQHSHITVEQMALTSDPLVITTNVDQLRQVLLNLLLNAIDAMPNGGHLRISTNLDTLGHGVELSPAVRLDFTDSGHGIPPEHLNRIFEPFFTTKETGSGLGLSISYELVQTLGGDMTVTSEMGAGATFTLRLPLETAGGNT